MTNGENRASDIQRVTVYCPSMLDPHSILVLQQKAMKVAQWSILHDDSRIGQLRDAAHQVDDILVAFQGYLHHNGNLIVKAVHHLTHPVSWV